MATRHRYGPHDPDHAPNAVTILRGGRFGGGDFPVSEVRPIPDELVRQREAINRLAHEAAKCQCPTSVWVGPVGPHLRSCPLSTAVENPVDNSDG